MNRITKHAVAWLAAASLSGAAVQAGSFSSDFDDPNETGITLNGTALIEDGNLILTRNENSQQGTMVLDELDNEDFESFVVEMQLQIGPGSGNAADGFSLSVGPDVTSSSSFGEEGVGNGVIVAFDIYDNGGGEAPAIDIKYGGVVVANTMFEKADMVTGQPEAVKIEVTRSGTLNMEYKGEVLYQNVVLPGYAPMSGQFGVGGRTGGENANQWLHSLSVETVLVGATAPGSITADPEDKTVDELADAVFMVEFDGSAPLDFQWEADEGGTGSWSAMAGETDPTLTLTKVSAGMSGNQ